MLRAFYVRRKISVLTLSLHECYTKDSLVNLTILFMATLQVRIDDKTKKSAQKVLDKIGMDMSSAVKVYFKQIIITKGLPFQLLTENGLTVEQEQEIIKASEEAKRGVNVSGPFEGDEILNHLKKLRK